MKKKIIVKKDYREIFLKKISALSEYYVIESKKNYIIVCCFPKITINIEKNNNIFQPFKKNIVKQLPIAFPVIIEGGTISKKDLLVYAFHQRDIPIITLSKKHKNLTKQELEYLLEYHVEKISGNFDNYTFD